MRKMAYRTDCPSCRAPVEVWTRPKHDPLNVLELEPVPWFVHVNPYDRVACGVYLRCGGDKYRREDLFGKGRR